MKYTYASSNAKSDYYVASNVSSGSLGYVSNADEYQRISINIKDLPEWIKNERIKQGLSIRQLAEKSHVSKSAISNLENGGNPYITTCVAILFGLGYMLNLSEGGFKLTKLGEDKNGV